jgi:hypothetical protein
MASRKKNICKICGKKKDVTFEGNGVQYPVFSCPEHGQDERNEWARWWDLYHDRWKQNSEYWDQPREKPSCLVSYFCYKFREFYGYEYTLDCTNPVPYTSKDFIMARRILALFQGNAKRVKNYIDWVFAKRIKKNYTINSFGFFSLPNLVNEYNAARAKSKILRRTTPLPQKFLKWCKEFHPNIFERQQFSTWDDLNGLVTYIKSRGKDNVEAIVVTEAVKQKMLHDENTCIKLED